MHINRPPSRVGLRPRHSRESSPDEKRPDSRLGARKQHSQYGHIYYDNGTAVGAGKSLFSNSVEAVRYTNPYEQELRISTASQRRDHQPGRRSRSSDRERRWPRDDTRQYVQRSRSADANRKGRVQSSDQYIPGDYMHTTASFDSYRKKALKTFQDTRKAFLTAPATPFVPASACAERSTSTRKGRPASRDMARIRMEQGYGVVRGRNSRDQIKTTKAAGRQEKRPVRSRKSANGNSRKDLTRINGNSGGSKTASKRNGTKEKLKKSNGEQFIEEMSHSMMQELTKVVDVVSSDLRVVSQQLKVLSSSMSDSMFVGNASRDMSRSYGDIRVGLQGTTDIGDAVDRYADISPSQSSSEWNQQQLHERRPGYGGQTTSPQKALARSLQHSDKRVGASGRYITANHSSLADGKHHVKSDTTATGGGAAATASTGYLNRGGDIAENAQSSTRWQQSPPNSDHLQLGSDSDRILTKMIKDGIRNKLLQSMRDSSD